MRLGDIWTREPWHLRLALLACAAAGAFAVLGYGVLLAAVVLRLPVDTDLLWACNCLLGDAGFATAVIYWRREAIARAPRVDHTVYIHIPQRNDVDDLIRMSKRRRVPGIR